MNSVISKNVSFTENLNALVTDSGMYVSGYAEHHKISLSSLRNYLKGSDITETKLKILAKKIKVDAVTLYGTGPKGNVRKRKKGNTGLEKALLAKSINAVFEEIENQGVELFADDEAEIIATIYEHLINKKELLDQNVIAQMVSLAKEK